MDKKKFVLMLVIIVVIILAIDFFYIRYEDTPLDRAVEYLLNESTNQSDYVNNAKFFVSNAIGVKAWIPNYKIEHWIQYLYKISFLRADSISKAPYILRTSIGACGEHAWLLSAILERAGILSVVVEVSSKSKNKAQRDSHAFNYVYLEDDNFIIADASSVGRTGINDLTYPTRDILHVSGIKMNNQRIDLTPEYAGITNGLVSIDYSDVRDKFEEGLIEIDWQGLPIGAKYELPSDGKVSINLGGNNSYNLNIYSKFLIRKYSKRINIESGKTTDVVVDKAPIWWIILFYPLLLLIIAIQIGIIIFGLLKKRKNNNKK